MRRRRRKRGKVERQCSMTDRLVNGKSFHGILTCNASILQYVHIEAISILVCTQRILHFSWSFFETRLKTVAICMYIFLFLDDDDGSEFVKELTAVMAELHVATTADKLGRVCPEWSNPYRNKTCCTKTALCMIRLQVALPWFVCLLHLLENSCCRLVSCWCGQETASRVRLCTDWDVRTVHMRAVLRAFNRMQYLLHYYRLLTLARDSWGS